MLVNFPWNNWLSRWSSSLRRIATRRASKPPFDEAAAGGPSPSDIRPLASRYEPCHALARSGIPTVVWFEDALVLYGSDTAVFDLYLLVPDARKAARVLQRAGYEETDLKSVFPNDERSCRGGIRLEPAWGCPVDGTVLINAADWNYDLRNRQQDCPLAPLPPLNNFLDSLMGYWLSMTEDEYSEKYLWALSLVNLINYGYNLKGVNGEVVRSADFAKQLQPEFSELHYDLTTSYPQKCGISCYGKHEYHALRFREIQQGRFIPRPFSSGNFPPSLAEYPRLTGLDAPPSRSSLGRKRHFSQARLRSIDEVLF